MTRPSHAYFLLSDNEGLLLGIFLVKLTALLKFAKSNEYKQK